MISQVFSSFIHVLRSPTILTRYRLWSYAIAPIIVAVVIGLSVLPAAYYLGDNLGELIFSWYDWDVGKEVVDAIKDWIGGVIIAVGLVFVFKYLILIASSPFMSLLSERMEEEMYGQEESSHSMSSILGDLWRGIRVNLRNLLRELILTVPLTLLSFIPLVNFVTVPLIFVVQAYYAGFGNMDYAMERHYDTHNSVLFVRKNRGLAIGNGAAFLLLFLIPVIGPILCVMLTAPSASYQTLQLIHEDDRFV